MRIAAKLVRNLVSLALAPFWLFSRLVSRPRAPWLHVKVRPRVVELLPPIPRFARWLPGFARRLPTPLASLRRLAEHAGRDGAVRGVVFEIPPLASGWSAAAGLRDVIASLRKAGKQTVVWLPQGGGNKEAWLAFAADRVLLAPQATISLLGVAAEQNYLKALLDRAGVGMEVHARSEYKTAVETFSRESMSEPQREQLTALLATFDRHLREAVASRPRVAENGVPAIFEQGFFTGRAAIDAGLADGLAYEDELPVAVGSEKEPAKLARAGRYFAWKEARLFARILPRPYIAVVPVHGTIGIGGNAGPFGEGGAGLEPLVARLRAARADPRAVGVVLHVDSPGGSALVSDLVHREVERLAEKKPVVACFANTAASGGYYVAAPCAAIVARPLTITGSIGVVSAKLVARELLAKLSVHTETIRTAPHADMLSAARPLDEAEHAILERETQAFYDGFVGLVAKGRKKTAAEIEPLARGRVWSGDDAHARGLVDRLGGLDVAVEEVRARLPAAIAALAEPALPMGPMGELPPAEPRIPAAAAALFQLYQLAMGGERLLAYALAPSIE